MKIVDEDKKQKEKDVAYIKNSLEVFFCMESFLVSFQEETNSEGTDLVMGLFTFLWVSVCLNPLP